MKVSNKVSHVKVLWELNQEKKLKVFNANAHGYAILEIKQHHEHTKQGLSTTEPNP